jgi:hypothetical protein
MTTTDQTIIKSEYDSYSAASRKYGELELREISMASSLTDTVVNRLRDDWGEAKNRAKHVAREFRIDYHRLTGSDGSKKARKPDPRKYPKARSGGGR